VPVLETEIIRQSIVQLEGRRSEAQRLVAEANKVLETVERELLLLRELLRIREPGEQHRTLKEAGVLDSVRGAVTASYTRSDSTRIVDEVVTILAEAGAPLPIRVIFDELKNRRVPLPGQGRMVNVIAAIRRSDLISRPARGVYALSAWAPANDQGDHPADSGSPRRLKRRQRHAVSRRKGSGS
jgi:hypothetical protein